MRITAQGQGLVTMALWFSAHGGYSWQLLAIYHVMIWLTLIGKNAIMVFILVKLGQVPCDNYVPNGWGIVIAKSLAVVFMSVKIMSNIPDRLMLRYSMEFKNHKKCPFLLYIIW